MKRILIAVTVALAVFGGAFAFAASLGGITAAGTVGDSAAVVASCDTDGVTTSFSAPAWDAGIKHYGVTDLGVSGIDAACDGDTIDVTLTDSSGASLGEATGTVSGTSASLTFSPAVASTSVEGIEVVIAS
ncbi:MAG TPA: hypothetical protein VMJ49_12670 [Gaiellaceae bacterium]|nr:hypothetical protein [Gaiellaceae bacterium]